MEYAFWPSGTRCSQNQMSFTTMVWSLGSRQRTSAEYGPTFSSRATNSKDIPKASARMPRFSCSASQGVQSFSSIGQTSRSATGSRRPRLVLPMCAHPSALGPLRRGQPPSSPIDSTLSMTKDRLVPTGCREQSPVGGVDDHRHRWREACSDSMTASIDQHRRLPTGAIGRDDGGDAVGFGRWRIRRLAQGACEHRLSHPGRLPLLQCLPTHWLAAMSRFASRRGPWGSSTSSAASPCTADMRRTWRIRRLATAPTSAGPVAADRRGPEGRTGHGRLRRTTPQELAPPGTRKRSAPQARSGPLRPRQLRYPFDAAGRQRSTSPR